ncbi:hypothetical protein HMPREF0083_00494 [Aneurinibacillus aneurinilyticus ATCC 12856]|uniref:Uncharacterized protein n=1 Tax=Aneurinibacillus aneurinilyticus ATCC 12856 TaxID=649747 RepID=U1YKU6_ANEAE|nr:hypothetical protein HMPREF0083_00494 [Aneurinibacillus aneurinilyticus ATCC 12856]
MFSVGGNETLLTSKKLGRANRLIISNHRFILKKNVVNFSIQKFF